MNPKYKLTPVIIAIIIAWSPGLLQAKPKLPEFDAKIRSDKVVNVVKKVMPSVVSVHSEKIMDVRANPFFNPFEDFFNDPFGQRRQQPRTRKRKQEGLGSGVIVSKDGYVLTNHHVAGDADEIKVTLSDEKSFEADVVGSDKLSDVAVLKIKNPPKNLPVADLGNSEELEVGETVIAIGSPFGYSNTVTKGIISAKGRTVGLNLYENYLQTDASINPGNSGGALINLDGQLIGINTAIASRSGASNGIGFAIPINMAKNIMDNLIGKGKVVRGYLGVYLQNVDQNLAAALGLKKSQGALITSVIENSPAEKAGFKEKDVILSVNKKFAKNVNAVRNLVALLEPNKSYGFSVLRDGKKITVKVKMGEREDDLQAKDAGGKSGPKLGLTLENITPNHVNQFRLNIRSGVIVTQVEPGAPADKAGFQRGDVLLAVGKKKIASVSEFKTAVAKAGKKTVLVQVDRQGGKLFLGLSLK